MSEIAILDTWEAIRKRPHMYTGPLDAGTPNRLLQEALCQARVAGRKGECQGVEIAIYRDGGAILEDSGPGWPVDVKPGGTRMAEMLLTQLFACREAKDPEHQGLCNTGVVTLVALSAWFTFQTISVGRKWRLEFERGRPLSALIDAGPTDRRGTIMGFTLDRSILPHVEFDPSGLASFFKELQDDGLGVTLADYRHHGVLSR